MGPADSEEAPTQDTLQVPAQKVRKVKSPTPTPGSMRERSNTPFRRSQTPLRGRSSTPIADYMMRRSVTPSTWRSISPFLKRDEKEKTPFELGRDMKSQTTCNKAVLDHALVMDISEPEDIQKPIRYITSDLSIIDRAAVMDISNVEVIYVVEEYDEEEEIEVVEEIQPKKKSSRDRKERKKSRASESDESAFELTPEPGTGSDESRAESVEHEGEEGGKKGRKKGKKKDKKEESPGPHLTLNLEIGGGQKATKEMFEEAASKPPKKKTKKALMEERAAKAKAKEEERQRRIKEEKERKERERKEAEERARKEAEERARREAEQRAREEAEAAALAAELEAAEQAEYDENWDEDGEYNYDEDEEGAGEQEEVVEEVPEEKPKRVRHGSTSSEEYVRPDPDEEERWQRVTKEEPNDFMKLIGKYTQPERLSEKERDRVWKEHIAQGRLPRFVIFLSDQTAQAGNKVRLSCAYEGPGVSVKWFKDNRKIERDENHQLSNVNYSLALTINETTKSDSGVYKCVISNMNGETESSAIVTIYEDFRSNATPPSFRLIREYYHLKDDELTIECQVIGVPRPKVTWYWEGMDIVSSYKHTLIEEDDGVCKLLIYKPTYRDNGKYIVVAENPSGQAKIIHMLEVASDLHYPLPGVFHARDPIQQEKERATRKIIAAALKSKAESDRKLAKSIGSVHNGPLVVSEKPDENSHPDHMNHKAESDGQEEKRVRPAETSPKDQLYFITHLANRYVAEGSRVQLQAIIGGPKAVIRWQKDDQDFEYGPHIHHKNLAGVASLVISIAHLTDSGKYTIIAENESTKVTSSAQVQVYQTQLNSDVEPVFSRPIKETFHYAPYELELETTVRGHPRPDVWWYRDGADILNGERFRVKHLEDGICRLTVDSPTNRDSGKYMVVAQNRAGKTTITHSVTIEVNLRALSPTKQTAVKGEKKQEVLYERKNRLPDASPKDRLYFISNLTNRYVAEGSKVVMQAVIGGPKSKLHWLKDDEDIEFGPHVHHHDFDGFAKMVISKAHLHDAGKYTLVAQNNFSKVTSSAVLHVYQPTINADAQPIFSRSLKEFYDASVNELVLETGVRGNPTPDISWYRDGIDILNGGRYKIYELEDGIVKLVIESPTSNDSGRYVIMARNSVGESTLSHRVLFEPRPRPKIEENEEVRLIKERNWQRLKKEMEKEEKKELPPLPDLKQQLFFRNHLSNRTIQEGSTVKWVVTIDGPKPAIVWYHNGKVISSGSKCKFAYKNGIAWLKVFNVATEDAGEYKLIAKGPENEVVSFCELTTYSLSREEMIAPSFATRIKDNYVLEDKALVLDCRVLGKPRPEIEWFKDGEELEIGEKYMQVDEEDGYSKLVISHPTKNDSGQYTCLARNDVSFTKMTHSIEFGGADLLYYEKTHGNFRRDPRKPHFLYPLGNQSIAVGGCAAICAEFLPMNDIFDVHWYLDHDLLKQESDIKMIIDKGIHILLLMDASVATQGTYTCRASTLLHGYTDSNAHVDVAVAVPKEERPPLFLERPESKINVAVGEPIIISCEISNVPSLKFSVFHGTLDITRSDKVSKEISGEKVQFTIQTTQMDDSGIYFIVARNTFGTDRVFVIVTMTSEHTEN